MKIDYRDEVLLLLEGLGRLDGVLIYIIGMADEVNSSHYGIYGLSNCSGAGCARYG